MKYINRREAVAGLGALSIAAPVLAARVPQWDVIVIGAGISGLRTALELESQGLRVKILEARDRIGGRLYTLDDVPGGPEAGGSVIGSLYARVQDTVRRFGLQLEPMRAREPSEYARTHLAERVVFHLKGRYVTVDEWPKHAGNPFPESMKSVMPWSFSLAALAPHNPLKELDDWLKPGARAFDAPLDAILRQYGISDEAIRLGVGENQAYGSTPSGVSTLHHLQLLTWATHMTQRDGLFHIVGGNQRMPEAMAAALKEPVQLQTPVSAVHDRGDFVLVETAGGHFEAKRVVISLPATALRHIKITPELPSAQRQGIAELTYSKTTLIAFRIDEPYWEQDGLPPTVWTDTAVGQLLAFPYGPGGATQSAYLWMMGADAEEADKLSPRDLLQRSMTILERLRPKAAKALVPLKVFSWQKERYTGGTWASWAPGQISAFANAIGRPHGRLHFCGEHTARLDRGMEGAMESADRVTLEILEKML